jgi:hypothetical protein
MMNLEPDKLTTSKQYTIEQVDINRTTNCNLFARITTRVRTNLSKNNNQIKEAQGAQDKRFVPKVRLTIKVAYVSVEVPTKD